MSLNKAIKHNKEKRKEYYGAKRIDPSCRNHGGCPYCEGNRLYKAKLSEEKEYEILEEWKIQQGSDKE